jgi:hypothetical protein
VSSDRLNTVEALQYGFDLFGFSVPLAGGALVTAAGLMTSLRGLSAVGALYKLFHDTDLARAGSRPPARRPDRERRAGSAPERRDGSDSAEHAGPG